MARLNLITVPHPTLKTKAEPVNSVDVDVKTQMHDMLETMYDCRGIGLAANQVDKLNRVFVMDVAPDSWYYGDEQDGVVQVISGYRSGQREEEEPKSAPVCIANPEIIWESEKQSVFLEGCLSIPEQYAEIVRPAEIRVRYLDENNETQEMEAAGLVSHAIQHEIDHLNGILFIDYLSPLKRNMMVKKVKKLMGDASFL